MGSKITGQGNVVNIPVDAFRKPNLESNFPSILSDKYDVDNALSPLDNAVVRFLDHISKLRNNSVTNLFMGMGIAIVGVFILSTALFQVSSLIDPSNHTFDAKTYILSSLVPRLSVTLFVQVFAYFFLTMYRNNQSEIKYFQNELSVLDSFATAILAAQIKNAPNLKSVIANLCKNERNRVMKKGEEQMTSSDDLDFIRTLSALANWAELKKNFDNNS